MRFREFEGGSWWSFPARFRGGRSRWGSVNSRGGGVVDGVFWPDLLFFKSMLESVRFWDLYMLPWDRETSLKSVSLTGNPWELTSMLCYKILGGPMLESQKFGGGGSGGNPWELTSMLCYFATKFWGSHVRIPKVGGSGPPQPVRWLRLCMWGTLQLPRATRMRHNHTKQRMTS